jgi:hypothetical protein
MLVSHESPLELLDLSRSYNDYDYALVHLFEIYPQYYDFFKDELKRGRRVLLDNSLFELGVAFDADKFAQKIIELQPTEYIVPDVWENCNDTIMQFEHWINKYNNLPGKKIGVIQGKNFDEFTECYKFMEDKADKIAISFAYSDFKYHIKHPNDSTNYMLGRISLMSNFLHKNIINKKKPHHLLGCGNPLEFSYYNKKYHNFIETIDTSSPIVHAILNIKYPKNMHNWSKKDIKLVDLIDTPLNQINFDILQYNLKRFKEFIKF